MILKLDRDDTMFVVFTIVIPVVAWWMLQGRRKYSTKGAK